MLRIEVLERVPKRHPDVTKGDAVYAWKNAIACAPAIEQNPNRYYAIGPDSKGRLIELVGVIKSDGSVLIIHGQTPPQQSIKKRLNLLRRKGNKHG